MFKMPKIQLESPEHQCQNTLETWKYKQQLIFWNSQFKGKNVKNSSKTQALHFLETFPRKFTQAF
jgi:hypothetical protein